MASIMTVNCKEHTEQQSATVKYVWAGTIVQDLPTTRSSNKDVVYYIKVSFGGQDVPASRKMDAKESMMVWCEEGDRREFNASPDSVLRVTVNRHITSRTARKGIPASSEDEEMGAASLTAREWWDAIDATALAVDMTHKNRSAMRISLFLTQDGESSLNWGTNDPVLFHATLLAMDRAQAMHVPPWLDKIAGADDTLSRATDSASAIVDAWKPLFQGLGWFVSVMDVVTEALDAQQKQDGRILKLVEAMKSGLDFRQQAESLQAVKPRATFNPLEATLCQLSRKIAQCACFIWNYAKRAKFTRRMFDDLLENLGGKTNSEIVEYKTAFDELRESFHPQAQLQILHYQEELRDDIRVRDIKRVDNAGFQDSMCALPDTRVDVINEIMDWAHDP
ncbi:hypothetical protein CALCODRAFT_485754 [Calocera cornea HHB12733]|uniref:Uncharacterized protein n=1 Tax=Calocera cornea HHB12733 TaxID=1353952 RepID=A0A165E5T5_9BASI|nr:hypothetical protein CALCODRAFT_485754 [Calocera cornea HHB12733]